jgi:hypothetical protein
MYKGTIVEESLVDKKALESFRILNTIETDEENLAEHWHIHKVEGDEISIQKLADSMKAGPWYAHFWSEERLIAVFRGKVLTGPNTSSTLKKFAKYGADIGIPKEQLDFKIEN